MPMTQTGTTPNIAVARLVSNATGQTAKANDALTAFAILGQLHVKSRTTATAPGSPAEGDAYILPSGHSGFAAGASADDVCWYSNGWAKVTPQEGWHAWVEDEDVISRFSGTNWIEAREVGSVQSAITASTTQTQGQGALTKVLNQVSVCANANDTVTLPAARKGLVCVVANDGAQTLQVFPASADAIDALSANASTTVAAGKRRIFYALDGTTWVSVLGA